MKFLLVLYLTFLANSSFAVKIRCSYSELKSATGCNWINLDYDLKSNLTSGKKLKTEVFFGCKDAAETWGWYSEYKGNLLLENDLSLGFVGKGALEYKSSSFSFEEEDEPEKYLQLKIEISKISFPIKFPFEIKIYSDDIRSKYDKNYPTSLVATCMPKL